MELRRYQLVGHPLDHHHEVLLVRAPLNAEGVVDVKRSKSFLGWWIGRNLDPVPVELWSCGSGRSCRSCPVAVACERRTPAARHTSSWQSCRTCAASTCKLLSHKTCTLFSINHLHLLPLVFAFTSLSSWHQTKCTTRTLSLRDYRSKTNRRPGWMIPRTTGKSQDRPGEAQTQPFHTPSRPET